MDARDVVHACSNADVAQAAVLSIGGAFVVRFSSAAHRNHLACGSFAAWLVREFGRTADAAEWGEADAAARGVELPVLECLRFILDRRLDHPEQRNAALN